MRIHYLNFIFVALLAIFGFSSTAHGQIDSLHRPFSGMDISLGFYQKGFSGAVSWNRLYPIAFKKRFSIGYGVRFTSYFGNEAEFVTAPASVTEGNFFVPQNEVKMDTVLFEQAQTNSLNAAIYLQYRISSKLSVGFNIDAIGFSFGAQQNGVFSSVSEGFAPTPVKGKVTSLNLLLTGDYDYGSLNSEIYARYLVGERMALRAGACFLFSEYTTEQKLAFDNDRFRRKNLGFMLALAYRL